MLTNSLLQFPLRVPMQNFPLLLVCRCVWARPYPTGTGEGGLLVEAGLSLCRILLLAANVCNAKQFF